MAKTNAVQQTRQNVSVSASKAGRRPVEDHKALNEKLRADLTSAIAERQELIEALDLAEILAETPELYIADPAFRKAQRKIDRIMTRVTEANEGLMVSAVQPWLTQGFTGTENRQDLLTVAFSALFESFTTWDPSKGSAFSSWYLNFGFKKAMSHYVSGSLKGWPTRLIDNKSKIDGVIDYLEEKFPGEKPTNAQILTELEWPNSDANNRLLDIMRTTSVSLDGTSHTQTLVTAGNTTVNHADYYDHVSNETDHNTSHASSEEMRSLLANPELSPLEVFITIRRNGLDGYGNQNLASLANDTGIGRESIRRAAVKLDKKLETLLLTA